MSISFQQNIIGKMKNKFISFEGGEGSGKTTQSKKLYNYFLEKGCDAIWTREIGGTEIAEKIRDIVVNDEISTRTELLLIMAARSEHLEKVIKPALAEGKFVICDRYIDSTAAYQSVDKADIEKIFILNQMLFDNFLPDLTFYLKIDESFALDRAIARGNTNKYEEKDISFHLKTSANYELLSSLYKGRIRTIDASQSEENIFEEIIKQLNYKL